MSFHALLHNERMDKPGVRRPLNQTDGEHETLDARPHDAREYDGEYCIGKDDRRVRHFCDDRFNSSIDEPAQRAKRDTDRRCRQNDGDT